MPVGTWKLFQKAKKNLGKGAINLSNTTFRIALVGTSSGIFTNPNLYSIWQSLTANETPNGNGYTDSGKALASELWTGTGAVASAATLKWDAADVIWSAVGGDITSIKGAVIFASAAGGSGKLLCWVSLSSSSFTLSQGNTLTIQMNTEGIFKMY